MNKLFDGEIKVQTLLDESMDLIDTRLLRALEGFDELKSIEEVIEMMNGIDASISDMHRLKAFNYLYRIVSEMMKERCENAEWNNPAWVNDLVVEFAKLYFQGIKRALEGEENAPKCWSELMKKENDEGSDVLRALSGVNAHINYDLMTALSLACEKNGVEPRYLSPEWFDHVAINEILYKSEVMVIQELTKGRIKKISEALEPFDRFMMMASIAISREVSWFNAVLRDRLPFLDGKIDELADRFATRLTRLMLGPVQKVLGK